MTKFNRKADVIRWSDIKDRIDELEISIVSTETSLTDVKHKNNMYELTELRRLDDLLNDKLYPDHRLINSDYLCQHVIDWDYHASELRDIFDIKFKNLDQYLVDNNYVEIQMFGETYYY